MREPRHTIYLNACAAMFVFGIVLALPGTVLGLPDVIERLGLTMAERGALISALFLGLLIGSLLTGPMVDALGHRVALGGSAACIALCLPLFAAAPTYALAAAALAAIGLASAGINTAANALSSDFFPEERGRRMNGLAIAVGVGGLSLPAATALMAGYIPWSWLVAGGAVIAAATAISVTRVDPPAMGTADVSSTSATTISGMLGVVRQPGLVWVALLVALGGATEAVMAGFTSTYLTTLGFTPEAATWVLASHWVGVIAGRLAFGGRVDRAKGRAITVAALGGATGIVVFVTASSTAALAIAPFVIGVAIAVVVPTVLALGGERYPQNAGTLFGLLLTVAQAAAMVFPGLVGVVAEAADVRVAMSILVVNNVAIAGICLQKVQRVQRVQKVQ